MTCDLCGEREATVHLTEIINDQTRELHLCEPCAREKGAQAAQGFGLAELLAGLADFGSRLEGETKQKPTCPQCGMSYDDFRKSGRLGCGRCYETFHRFLAPLLKRIHGSIQHVGKVPLKGQPLATKAEGPVLTPATSLGIEGQNDELKKLKERLRQLVAQEAFEEAARLRDQIRALEGKPKRRAGGGEKRRRDEL